MLAFLSLLALDVDSFPALFLAAALLYVGLRSLLDALGIRQGDAWEWPRDVGGRPRLTWSHRLVLALINRFRRRTTGGAGTGASRPVRTLPPEPPAERRPN